jgi:hypothetical protein
MQLAAMIQTYLHINGYKKLKKNTRIYTIYPTEVYSLHKRILTLQFKLDMAKILSKLHNRYLDTEWPTILQKRKH